MVVRAVVKGERAWDTCVGFLAWCGFVGFGCVVGMLALVCVALVDVRVPVGVLGSKGWWSPTEAWAEQIYLSLLARGAHEL